MTTAITPESLRAHAKYLEGLGHDLARRAAVELYADALVLEQAARRAYLDELAEEFQSVKFGSLQIALIAVLDKLELDGWLNRGWKSAPTREPRRWDVEELPEEPPIGTQVRDKRGQIWTRKDYEVEPWRGRVTADGPEIGQANWVGLINYHRPLVEVMEGDAS